jgi:hypothetical protein
MVADKHSRMQGKRFFCAGPAALPHPYVSIPLDQKRPYGYNEKKNSLLWRSITNYKGAPGEFFRQENIFRDRYTSDG